MLDKCAKDYNIKHRGLVAINWERVEFSTCLWIWKGDALEMIFCSDNDRFVIWNQFEYS